MEIMQMKEKIETLKLNLDREMKSDDDKKIIKEIFYNILEDWPDKSAKFFEYIDGFQKRLNQLSKIRISNKN